MIATKPSKCRHCKQRMEVVGHKIHPECVDAWYASQRDKLKAKKEREEKRCDRAKRESMKTMPTLKKEAQKEFNAYIRLRDKDLPCISCGAPPPDMAGLHAGRDAGHYRSVGSAAHLRFDERNVHAQCVHCNQWGAGRAVDYRIGLVARLGIDVVEALEQDNDPLKFDRDTLRQIKTIYRAKTRELKRAE